MKFSIVTSFYNEPIELIEAVCQSVLSQTYSNFEWVITDDFSQDEVTTNFVKTFKEASRRALFFSSLIFSFISLVRGDIFFTF